MNKIVKRHLWTRLDDSQNELKYAEEVGEPPEVCNRLAEIVSLYKSILNPVTPTADDPSAFIPLESPKEPPEKVP